MSMGWIKADDLDGTTGEVSDVTLSLNGRTCQLDLSEANLKVLTELLQPYFDAGRAEKRPAATSGKTGRTATSHQKGDSNLRAVREWAVANGFEIKAAGRLPKDILDAYEKRGGQAMSASM